MNKYIKLKNNIQIIYRKIPYIKSANIGMFIKCGSLNENKINNGISHIIEHILFKGTKNKTAKDIALDIDKVGGDLNAYTTVDYTCFYLRVLSKNIYKGLDILLDLLINTEFNELDLENEKKVIFDEIDNYEDDSEELATNELYKMLYKEEYYKYSILGEKNILENISKKEILDYKEKYYNSSNIVISIVGNFEEENIVNYLENIHMNQGEKNKEENIIDMTINKSKNKKVLKDYEQITSYININKKIDYKKNKYELILLNNIFGDSVSSRLFQKIREDLGLTYNINSFILDNNKDANMNIYFTCNNDNLIELNNEIFYLMDNFLKDEISVIELNTSKNQLISELILTIEDPYEEMIINGENLLLKNEVFNIDKEILKIEDVNLLKINEIKNEIFKVKDYNSIYIGNLSKENIVFLNNRDHKEASHK